MTGPTHRKYDSAFRYLGRFDRDGNLVEPPDAEKTTPAECPTCGCRHFVRAGEKRVCRHCGRRMPRGAENADEKPKAPAEAEGDGGP